MSTARKYQYYVLLGNKKVENIGSRRDQTLKIINPIIKPLPHGIVDIINLPYMTTERFRYVQLIKTRPNTLIKRDPKQWNKYLLEKNYTTEKKVRNLHMCYYKNSKLSNMVLRILDAWQNPFVLTMVQLYSDKDINQMENISKREKKQYQYYRSLVEDKVLEFQERIAEATNTEVEDATFPQFFRFGEPQGGVENLKSLLTLLTSVPDRYH